MLAQLAVHPHIVTIYAMGVTDGYPWLAMEFSAATLAQRLSEDPADPGEVHRLLEQVARGLSAMHALKPPLIHQDLKPANLLLDEAGNYKITDFSLATVTAANRTHGLATVRYAAPELLSSEFGKVGPWTDLYALGHIAYELALGGKAHRAQFPAVFEGNSGRGAAAEPPPNKWMMWHASINTRPAPASEVLKAFPANLSDIVARLMAKSLGERYASADDLLGDLAVTPVEAAAVEPHPEPSAPPLPGRHAPARGPAAPSGAGAIPLSTQAPAAGKSASTPAPASSQAASSSRYWVRLRGRVSGPYDLATLQRQVKSGAISRLHQVSADQVTWKAASEIEGLYGPTIV